MSSTVVAFEGPVGVGKTTLGRVVSARLKTGFIDGDDYSVPGLWLSNLVVRTDEVGFELTCDRLVKEVANLISRPPIA